MKRFIILIFVASTVTAEIGIQPVSTRYGAGSDIVGCLDKTACNPEPSSQYVIDFSSVLRDVVAQPDIQNQLQGGVSQRMNTLTSNVDQETEKLKNFALSESEKFKKYLKQELMRLQETGGSGGVDTLPPNSLDLITFRNRTYFFSKFQTFPWLYAAAFCRIYGMELVSIENQEDDNTIISALKNFGLTGNYVYTSGNNIGSFKYMWLSGRPVLYTNWYADQPNNPDVEKCIIYYNNQWHDLSCTVDGYFICEQVGRVS